MASDRAKAGREGEDRAAALLEAAGLRIVARNVRFRGGELDIVATDADVLVFVEVRARGPTARVGAADSVGARKRQRLLRAAGLYLAREGAPKGGVRFDVVAFEADGRALHLRHAFRADD